MNGKKKVQVGRIVAFAACLVVLAASLSCELAGEKPGSDGSTGNLALKITTLKSLVSSASSGQRAIAFADRLTLTLLNEDLTATAYEKTFTLDDDSEITLDWDVAAGTYGKLVVSIFNDAVSTEEPVVSGWIFDNDESDEIDGVVVTAGATTAVSIVCTPDSRAGDIYPYNLEYNLGGNVETVSLGVRGEAWFGVHSSSLLTKVTIVADTVSGSSRASTQGVDYLAGIYGGEGSAGYLAGGEFTSSGALLFETIESGFYYLVVAANSAADFSVSVEDVVDLSATATATDLTNGKVAWYAVTVPEGSSGQLSVALSGTYDSAAPLTVTLYGTDSSTMLDSATLSTMTSSVTATSTDSVTAGRTYFIKVSGGDGTDSYGLSWTVALLGSLSIGVS